MLIKIFGGDPFGGQKRLSKPQDVSPMRIQIVGGDPLFGRGLIAQWIRARVSEARSRGFNSLFAQYIWLKTNLSFILLNVARLNPLG